MPKIFISYSAKDEAAIIPLRDELRNHQNEAFFAGDSIPPGSDGWKTIFANLEAADEFFFMASTDSCQSTAVHRELSEALRLKKPITIFRLGIVHEKVPQMVQHLQSFDFSKREDYNRALSRIGKINSQKSNDSANSSFWEGAFLAIMFGVLGWALSKIAGADDSSPTASQAPKS